VLQSIKPFQNVRCLIEPPARLYELERDHHLAQEQLQGVARTVPPDRHKRQGVHPRLGRVRGRARDKACVDVHVALGEEAKGGAAEAAEVVLLALKGRKVGVPDPSCIQKEQNMTVITFMFAWVAFSFLPT
jgi:hypothetical protein